jgi:hypothetical protein
VVRDAICGRPKEVVPEEVALVAHYDQVEAAFVRAPDNQLGRVAGADVDRQVDALFLGLFARQPTQRVEESVFLSLDLVDLADRRCMRPQASLLEQQARSPLGSDGLVGGRVAGRRPRLCPVRSRR